MLRHFAGIRWHFWKDIKMYFDKSLFYVCVLGVLSAPLPANDTTATIAGGVITYTLTDEISMDREVLQITEGHISVDYTFTNHGQKDVEVDVAFPLPPSPITLFDTWRVWPSWDDTYRAYRFVEDISAGKKEGTALLSQAVSGNAFTNFTRTVDDVAHGTSFHVKAIDSKGKDITSLLAKHKIPLSALYVGGHMEEPALERDPALKKKLSRLGLLSHKGAPLWQTFITYYWRQNFPANKSIHVTHAYRPYTGLQWLSLKDHKKVAAFSLDDLEIHHRDVDASGRPEKKKLTDFNISEDHKMVLRELFDPELAIKKYNRAEGAPVAYRIKEVRYILSTGANWKGPIASFRLEITPSSKSTLVLTSFDANVEKGDDGVYRFETQNFKPTRDLKVLFIDCAL